MFTYSALHLVNRNYDGIKTVLNEKHIDEISIEEEHIKEKQVDKSRKRRERRSATSCSKTIQRNKPSGNFLTIESYIIRIL